MGAISSVLFGTRASTEIVVLDDSPEASAEALVTGLCDERIHYHHMKTPSGGRPARVRNRGLDLARGQYLYFLDDDDRVFPGALDALAYALDQHPKRAVAFGRVVCFGPDPEVEADYNRWFGWAGATARRFRFSSRLTVGIIMFRGTLIINSACMIRAWAARELTGYDDSIPVYEDVEFFTRAIRRFGHVFADRPVLQYSTGLPSLINDLQGDTAKIQESYAIFHRKYRDVFGDFDYRQLQIVSKALPLPRIPWNAEAVSS